jgi:hypothetical protein
VVVEWVVVQEAVVVVAVVVVGYWAAFSASPFPHLLVLQLGKK